VYVFSLKRRVNVDAVVSPHLLRRLDGATLAIQAQRVFDGWRRVLVRPAARGQR
jgi:hypothetical protein